MDFSNRVSRLQVRRTASSFPRTSRPISKKDHPDSSPPTRQTDPPTFPRKWVDGLRPSSLYCNKAVDENTSCRGGLPLSSPRCTRKVFLLRSVRCLFAWESFPWESGRFRPLYRVPTSLTTERCYAHGPLSIHSLGVSPEKWKRFQKTRFAICSGSDLRP